MISTPTRQPVDSRDRAWHGGFVEHGHFQESHIISRWSIIRIPSLHRRKEGGCRHVMIHDVVRGPQSLNPTTLQQQASCTQVPDNVHVVRDDQDCSTTACRDVTHFSHTFLLKLGVSHGQDFIDNQNLPHCRVGRDRKGPLSLTACHSNNVSHRRINANFSTPAKSTMASNCLLISVLVMPRIEPFR